MSTGALPASGSRRGIPRLALALVIATGMIGGAWFGLARGTRTAASGSNTVLQAATAETDGVLHRLAFRLAVLERRLEGEAPASPGRPATAELTLALLALGEIQEHVQAGQPFAAPFQVLRESIVAARQIDPEGAALGRLAMHAERGVPSLRRIEASFGSLRRLLEELPDDDGWPLLRHLHYQMMSVLADLHMAERPEPSQVSAATQRIDAALREADLAGAVTAAATLGGAAREVVGPWLLGLRARLEVETEIAALRQRAWQGLLHGVAP